MMYCMEKKDNDRIADFLYEIGSMRKLMRMHRQTLLSDDSSDTIASHTYRVTMIGWLLAKMENVDPYKVTMMCLVHDLGEIRANDHNWVHKRYVKVFEDEIREDQLKSLPFDDLFELASEYDNRESKEALVAKDADMLDQVLLLKEYEWQGNKEAKVWLHGKDVKRNSHLDKLVTESGKKLGAAIYEKSPSEWWEGLSTSENR